jgi:trigger factor
MPTVKHENTDALNAVLTVEIAKSDYLPKVNNQLKDYRKKAQIKGFRPGKVPMGMIKSRYGNSLLVDEVNELVGESINKYINDNKLKTIGQPLPIAGKEVQLNINKPEDYSFEFEIGLTADFELEGLSLDNLLPYYDIAVEDAQVDQEVEAVRGRFGAGFEENVTDIIDTDMLTISLAELDGDQIKEGGVTREETYLALRDVANEELKDNLLTATLEDTFDINVFEMEDKPAEHVRKHILGLEEEAEVGEMFRLTIKEIKRVKKAELNAEFFNQLFPNENIETEEAFRDRIKDEIGKNYKQASLAHFNDLVFDELIAKNEIELPLEFLKKWLKNNNEDLEDSYFEKKDFENFQRSLRWNIIREDLAERYESEVQMEEIENMVRQEVLGYFNHQIPAYGEMMDNMIKRVLSDQNETRRRFDMLMDQKVLQGAAENMGKDVKTISKEEFESMTKSYRDAKAAEREEAKEEEVATAE